MLTREQLLDAQAHAREYLNRAGIVLTTEESNNIEVADFGLGELETTGLEWKPSAVAGVPSISMLKVNPQPIQPHRYQQDANTTIQPGMRLCYILVSNTRSRPIPCTGFRPATRARLSQSFQRAAATNSTYSPIHRFAAQRSSNKYHKEDWYNENPSRYGHWRRYGRFVRARDDFKSATHGEAVRQHDQTARYLQRLVDQALQ